MSCVNLLANLVQGSYTHATVIPPAAPTNTTLPLDSVTIQPSTITLPLPPLPLEASPLDQSTPPAQPPHEENELNMPARTANAAGQPIPPILPQDTTPQNLAREFDTWLLTSFPQIEFQDHIPSISTVAFFAHHGLSLIVALFWVAILTTFKVGTSPSQIFIFLAIIVDPVLHIMLALAQQKLYRRPRTGHFSVVAATKITVWFFDLIGYIHALKILSGIYASSAGYLGL